MIETRVPYYNVPARFAADRDTIKRLVREAAASGELILKSRVAELEQALRRFTGAREVVATSSGTGALLLALAALDAGEGDEVITPAFSFHSSASTIAQLGARPVLVDVREGDFLIDVERAEAATTARTRGILPVHLFSAMADMPAIARLAADHDLWVLEDSAIALGMSWGGISAGRLGDIGVLSFHPVKPLAGTSDGGAVVTDDPHLARRARMLRNHGQDGIHRFLHHLLGFNLRMDDVVAGVLAHRLERYRDAIARRRELAERYDAGLADLAPELRTPPPVPHERIFYTYVVRSMRRDELEAHLAARGVETKVYYPYPLHLQPAFRHLGHARGDFPCAERAARELLALPLYPEMPDAHVDEVIEAVRSFHER